MVIPPSPVDSDSSTSPGRPRRGSGAGKGCLVALAIAVVAGLVLIVGAIMLVLFGMNVLSQQVASHIQDNPVIVEHIGMIEEIEFDYMASISEPADDVYVLRLRGSLGRGILTVESVTMDDDTENVTWGQLRVPSGDTLDLFPDQGAKPR